MAELPEEIRKVAVDTLYNAREAGKVMDEAAVAVAEAVLKKQGELVEQEAKRG